MIMRWRLRQKWPLEKVLGLSSWRLAVTCWWVAPMRQLARTPLPCGSPVSPDSTHAGTGNALGSEPCLRSHTAEVTMSTWCHLSTAGQLRK